MKNIVFLSTSLKHIVNDYLFWFPKVFSVVSLTAWKVSKCGVISGPNAGKYGPEMTPYLDTFHGVTNLNHCCINIFQQSFPLKM